MLNTIVAESVDELTDKLKTALKGSGATLEKAVTTVVKDVLGGEQADRVRRRRLLRGVAQGGREARPREPQNDPRRAAVARREIDGRRVQKVQSAVKAELEARYEVFTEQYVTNINIESETAASIGAHDGVPCSGPAT